ncbi:hypothetical protein COCVIDRAFT_97716 [Bipolaris victoriae FI3]|uniref:Uncharacterized protein n=1 Tax=Bipolaris victoriae (strain FI3) TaxID=930091 RepID=W7EU81_BIPV3|nr:hypothetical protein COCVIDRAFT_97716 [Bipolaris victoriae FI3]
MSSRRQTKKDRELEEARKKIRGEGYPRATILSKETTLESLKEKLKKHRDDQVKTRRALPDLIRQKTELLKKGDTKALGVWQENKENKRVTRKYRTKEHDDFTRTQSLLEDFLYFQNHLHRQNRYSKIKMRETRGWYLDSVNSNSGQMKPEGRQDILDAFDKAKIGGPRHRNGFLDWDGNEVSERGSDQEPRPIRFNELHLWTPACRRMPVGFNATKNMSVEATDLVLDIDNIRQKWQRIEEVEIPERGKEGFPYRTHIERRQQEQALYRSELGDSRPTTASLHLKKTPDGVKLQDRFWDIQVLDGVFISALESSYDWRTSYDLLGPVKSGIYANFTVSDERETIEPEPPEDDLDTNDEEQPEDQPEASQTLEEPSKEQEQCASTAPEPNRSVPKKRKRTVHLDYPYPRSEFFNPPPPKRTKHAPCNRPLTLSTPLLSTPWTEETPGRREYHVAHLLSPSSPVDSPPHTPISRPAPTSIPAPFPNDEVSPIDQAAQRRCTHEPERCRAWWSHAPDDCWIVESAAVVRPRSPVLHPILEIEGPEGEFLVPEGARKVYEGRVVDQYGVMGREWPRVGVRVPYEPMGLDGVGVGGSEDGEEEGKVVREYRAMAAPVIPLVERDEEELVGVAGEVDTGGSAGYESDGSDYDGDIFRSMYISGHIGSSTQAPGS